MAYLYLMLFVETKLFTRTLLNHLDDEEFQALQRSLLLRPEQGDLIPGLLGCRKVRWSGRGKRGGVRVIYYYAKPNSQLWFLALYAKNQKSDLSAQDKEALKTIVKAIKDD